MDRDSTCQLSLAGDMICMLRDGFFRRPEVEHMKGIVDTMSLGGDLWTVSASCGRATTRRVFLCTGSRPKPATLHFPFNPKLKVLDLDECMRRSHIPAMFPRDSKSVVAVIGNSHSGILCCQNLYEFSQCNKRILKVINFRRRPIKYAEYTERGIVFDNSGLKGRTAEWAKTVMESDPDPDMLEEIDSGKDQDSVFRKYLTKCTHIVYAIGYISSPWPKIYVEGHQKQEEFEFDMHSSGFHFRDKSARVPGLYGNGIAFPEQVKDPEGNIEAAVGIAKFFSFAERTKDSWLYVQ
ncbi:unnamed protein product [Penicillium olsonii]|nr:unnamed protein product [Penicillium olsonii]